ncbi:tetratricopeptide repeat protein [Lacinutrix neustonica]|uniref:Tetratricopeptide repeat protein n=1 Tax=Lacinutrix neustonica TaxID=2980107 RepID=A0A9E8SDS0_9FLAO|nr:tetratricopeptide repeat protein [Lacinutrix neustonica]WAC01519.1 tetratricopeptide repeat protein [Lacinutrix neustonica]
MSLGIRKGINNLSGISNSYNNIGNVYSFDEIKEFNPELALEYYQKATSIQLQTGQKSSLANTYHNISMIYRRKKNKFYCLETALEYSKLSFSICEEVNEKSVFSTSCSGLGGVYFDLNQYENSIYYFLKSYAINKIIKAEKDVNYSSIKHIRKNIGLG